MDKVRIFKQVNALLKDKNYQDALLEYNSLHFVNEALNESASFLKGAIKRRISSTGGDVDRENLVYISEQDIEYLEKAYFASSINHSKLLSNLRNYMKSGKLGWVNYILNRALSFKKDKEYLFLTAELNFVLKKYVRTISLCDQLIKLDPTLRKAYSLAEQSCIEIEDYSSANSYFLNQPKTPFNSECKKRSSSPVLAGNFVMPPVVGLGNDYSHILEKAELFKNSEANYYKKVSIIITVYNRNQVLANTVAALLHQTYPRNLMEIIVIDDGSCDDTQSVIKKYEEQLDLYLIRQPDKGYRLAKARNLGLKISTGHGLIFMDADILPLPTDVENYMRVLHVSDDAVLIGHRRYVDVSSIDDDKVSKDINVALALPTINPNNDVADRVSESGVSIDWRYDTYEKTNVLKDDLWPFNKASGGNIAFSKVLLEKTGLVDEEFEAWGCEDGEHGFRMFNAGAYFIPMLNIESLHQEPLNNLGEEISDDGISFREKGHEITREILKRKCPAPYARPALAEVEYDIPKVSIYIPAYNAERYIVEAVNSCLNQTIRDMEVVICNDGSTDSTLELLELNFANEKRVRWVSQENGGIGKATNCAISNCRGLYVGQLDADDRLKPNAIEECLKVLDYTNIDAVYSDCEYIDSKGVYIRDSWCGGNFDRSWMMSGMIATHFRMFKRRLWERTGNGANENIKNAVDLDLWLKFNERGKIEHIHKKLYQYRWHGKNTSVSNRKQQEQNHLKVVKDSLERQGLSEFWQVETANNPFNPREYKIAPKSYGVSLTDILVVIPTCKKYLNKANAVRNTWRKSLTLIGVQSYFVVGNENLKECELKEDTLYVPCLDNYESLLLKLALAYKFFHHNFKFKYLYKIDDDCFPNLEQISQHIIPQLPGNMYIGGAVHEAGVSMNDEWHLGKCSDKKFDKKFKYNVAPVSFAKGGYGYFLRKDSLPLIFENIPRFVNELEHGEYSYEDLRFAEILSQKKVTVHPAGKYKVVKNSESVPSDYSVVFDISNEDMFYKLYEK